MEPDWPFGNRPRPRRIWSLREAGRLMECEINEHPLGHEVRVYVQGDFHYSRVHHTLEAAEAEAAKRPRSPVEAEAYRQDEWERLAVQNQG
jgi:hypothetical protein